MPLFHERVLPTDRGPPQHHTSSFSKKIICVLKYLIGQATWHINIFHILIYKNSPVFNHIRYCILNRNTQILMFFYDIIYTTSYFPL